MLVRMEINSAQSRFIKAFFDTYLQLNSDEEEKLMKEIKQFDFEEEILNNPNFWEKKGMRKVALNMLRKGLAEELIVEVTDLDKSEIEELKKYL